MKYPAPMPDEYGPMDLITFGATVITALLIATLIWIPIWVVILWLTIACVLMWIQHRKKGQDMTEGAKGLIHIAGRYSEEDGQHCVVCGFELTKPLGQYEVPIQAGIGRIFTWVEGGHVYNSGGYYSAVEPDTKLFIEGQRCVAPTE